MEAPSMALHKYGRLWRRVMGLQTSVHKGQNIRLLRKKNWAKGAVAGCPTCASTALLSSVLSPKLNCIYMKKIQHQKQIFNQSTTSESCPQVCVMLLILGACGGSCGAGTAGAGRCSGSCQGGGIRERGGGRGGGRRTRRVKRSGQSRRGWIRTMMALLPSGRPDQ